MPDHTADHPLHSAREYQIHNQNNLASARPPIHEALGPHTFEESEFEAGKGRCDRCGGGPDAEIHQRPVDQLARIADALERIAAHREAMRDQWDYIGGRAALALERIAVGEKGSFPL